MRIVPMLAFTAALAVGVSGVNIPSKNAASGATLKALVRFSNELTSDSATLAMNGIVLFTAIAPGEHTDYIAISDSSVTLTLRGSGPDSVLARLRSQLLDQSHYTVIAVNNGTDRPMLQIRRD